MSSSKTIFSIADGEMSRKLAGLIAAMSSTLNRRRDVFFTTSLGLYSELMFFLMSEAANQPKVLCVRSPLSHGGIDLHRDGMVRKYGAKVHYEEVDRSLWVTEHLRGRELFDLDVEGRAALCRGLKRQPVMDFASRAACKVWVSGIRRDQTRSRRHVKLHEHINEGVVKYSPLLNWSAGEVQDLFDYLALSRNTDYVDLCKLNQNNECGLHY